MKKIFTQTCIVLVIAVCIIIVEFDFFVENKKDHFNEYSSSIGTGFYLIVSGLLYFVLICIFLILNQKNYKKVRTTAAFLPFVCCLLLPLVPFLHIEYVDRVKASPTLFKASSYKLNTGVESFVLDFKKDGNLVVHEVYGFSDLYYWGKYRQVKDTIFISFKKHELQHDTAIIKHDTLKLLADTLLFHVSKY